jgi:hypothetical protein
VFVLVLGVQVRFWLICVFFSFVLQVSELEENFNTKIRYQNWTEQEVKPTLEYKFNSSDYEF